MTSWSARLLRPLFLLVLALYVCTSVCACASSPTYRWKEERANAYRIGPSDKLRIAVWKHEEVSQEVTVQFDGSFALPLIGDVVASGRLSNEIARDLEVRLAKFYNDSPPVTVIVTEVKSYKIYLFGEVQKPGEYLPTQPVTVLMGLAMGGNFTPFANSERIVIVRHDANGERRIPFNFPAVVKSGELEQNIMLQSGDTIVVP